MLDTKWVAFLASVWITTSMVCLLAEGGFIGTGQDTILEGFMNCQVFTANDLLGKITGLFSTDLWSSIINMVTYNYGIFYGTWEVIRLIVFMPISVAVIYAVTYQGLKLIRGIGF